MNRSIGRRHFLMGVGAAGLASAIGRPGWARGPGPNEKLNLGIIGTNNRALANIDGVKGENIVAVCDIDDALLGKAAEKFPNAKTYVDFRKLIDAGGIDAVVVSTADHVHAPAAAMAMRMGKHVYCEKPLTHTVSESRVLARLAADGKLATQMGTQIHAEPNYPRVVELIQAGAIGPVRQVHVWLGTARWGGGDRPVDTPPIPKNLHWDLWVGPAPDRPYHPTYLPMNWRRWWAFGNGTLGDMACHFIDLPFWALKLRHPTTIEAQGPPVHPETAPEWLVVKYEFPARGDQPPVALTWYDGGRRPDLLAEIKAPDWRNGILFVGDKGMLMADYSRRILLPEADFKDFKGPDPTIPKSIGHHAEWIAACKDGRPTSCNFDYSGALTESVLLGNVAYRSGQKLDWDAKALKASNCSAADAFLRHDYRPGWTL